MTCWPNGKVTKWLLNSCRFLMNLIHQWLARHRNQLWPWCWAKVARHFIIDRLLPFNTVLSRFGNTVSQEGGGHKRVTFHSFTVDLLSPRCIEPFIHLASRLHRSSNIIRTLISITFQLTLTYFELFRIISTYFWLFHRLSVRQQLMKLLLKVVKSLAIINTTIICSRIACI